MLDITLQRTANQQFTVELNGRRVDLTFKAATNIMIVDIAVDEEVILRGHRLVVGEPMIPYRYLNQWGNLVLLTENNQLPWWEQFGNTQFLMFLTPEEIEEIRA